MSEYYQDVRVGDVFESIGKYKGQCIRVTSVVPSSQWGAPVCQAIWTDGDLRIGCIEKDWFQRATITWDEAVNAYNKAHARKQRMASQGPPCGAVQTGGCGDCVGDCEKPCDDRECETDDRWNTTCNRCGKPAYMGLTFECSNPDCEGGY